jgi:hypothetical protein
LTFLKNNYYSALLCWTSYMATVVTKSWGG